MAVRWLAETNDDRGTAARVGRDGVDLVAEWIGIARLIVRRDGSNVRFVPAIGADPAGIEKVRRGVVELLLRHLDGKLGLHGAAMTIGDRGVVLVGASGRGKSTLAAYGCSKHDAAFVSDDAVALERDTAGWRVVPLERDHWLDDDARRSVGFGLSDPLYGWKAPQRARVLAASSSEIALIAVLEWSDVDHPRLVRLHGAEAIAALIPLVVRFVIDEPASHRRELDHLCDLIEQVPIVRLERPRGAAHLRETMDRIVAAIGEGALPS